MVTKLAAIRSISTNSGFKLTSEQYEIQQLARKFSREEIIPKASYYDQTGEFPWQIVKKAHALGFMNVYVPKDIGELDNFIYYLQHIIWKIENFNLISMFYH